MTSWGETQLLVARDVQLHALPHYRVPYPACRDSYYGHGADGALSYEAYASAVASGGSVARPLHGCMHAARVTLFCALLAQLYRRAGCAVSCLYRLQMAAAFHDAARRDEGIDRWDADSAALFAAFLRARGAPDQAVDAWARCIAHKDGARPLSLDHTILHDADALDVQRARHVRNRFQSERLWLFRGDHGIPIAHKHALVVEAGRLIDLTDSAAQQRALEQDRTPYLRLLHIVVATQRACGLLPLMDALIGEVLAE